MPLAMSPTFKPVVEGLEGGLEVLERMLDGLEGELEVLEGVLEGILEVLEGVLEVLEGVLEVLEGMLEVLEVLEGVLEGPGTEPGASSGESINVRRGCETATEERDKGEDSHHRRHTIC